MTGALQEYVAGHGGGHPQNSTHGEPQRLDRPAVPQAGGVQYAVPGLSRVAETRFGFVQYFPDQDGAGSSLPRYGEYLQRQLMILAAVGLGKRVIVEAGAGIGHHALYLAKALRPDGHMILYENDTRLRRLLAENLASNGLDNATVMRRFLRGLPAAHADPTLDPADAPITSETIDELHLRHLDWLKIGESAGASEVLAGAEATLWRTRAKLFIAAADAAGVERLVRQVQDFGYCCWRVTTPVFDPDNFNLCREPSPGETPAFALLAIPEELGTQLSFVECERVA